MYFKIFSVYLVCEYTQSYLTVYNSLFVTFCCHVYVCYFGCSMFACNPVRLSWNDGSQLNATYLLIVDWKFSEPRNSLSYEVFLLICTHMASTSEFSLVARLATLDNSGNLHKFKMAATYF